MTELRSAYATGSPRGHHDRGERQPERRTGTRRARRQGREGGEQRDRHVGRRRSRPPNLSGESVAIVMFAVVANRAAGVAALTAASCATSTAGRRRTGTRSAVRTCRSGWSAGSDPTPAHGGCSGRRCRRHPGTRHHLRRLRSRRRRHCGEVPPLRGRYDGGTARPGERHRRRDQVADSARPKVPGARRRDPRRRRTGHLEDRRPLVQVLGSRAPYTYKSPDPKSLTAAFLDYVRWTQRGRCWSGAAWFRALIFRRGSAANLLPMYVIAHLSDPHLDGSEEARSRLRRITSYLREFRRPVDVVLVTGDLADHGLESSTPNSRRS